MGNNGALTSAPGSLGLAERGRCWVKAVISPPNVAGNSGEFWRRKGVEGSGRCWLVWKFRGSLEKGWRAWKRLVGLETWRKFGEGVEGMEEVGWSGNLEEGVEGGIGRGWLVVMDLRWAHDGQSGLRGGHGGLGPTDWGPWGWLPPCPQGWHGRTGVPRELPQRGNATMSNSTEVPTPFV